MLENDVLMEKSTVQIQQEEASEEYIKRFPTKLHEMLKDSRVRDKFFKSISKEYADIIVYRGIHRENRIERDDFLGNLDEAELYDRPVRKSTFQMCGVSVNEDPMQLIKALHIPNPGRPTLGIVRGIMKCKYGPADFQEGKTHHNWYLFEDKIDSASSEFKIIEVDELCQKNIGTKSGE
ncbi:hypothetical protein [Blautia sp.]|uniref:hypothetical protein n=1 Tax=Blautia sp. TaxID=1955243 RepID=UPI003FD74627